MRIEKAETKIAVASDIGAKIEDMLDATKKEVGRWEGSVSAFSQASKAIEGLGAHVDKDVEEGLYDLEAAKIVKRYLERAANATKNLGTQAEANRITTLGKVAALDVTVKVVAKYRDDETKKVEEFLEAVRSGRVQIENGAPATNGAPVEVSVRPPTTIKAQRLAEEAAEKAKAEASPVAEETKPETPTSKRGRKKRAPNA